MTNLYDYTVESQDMIRNHDIKHIEQKIKNMQNEYDIILEELYEQNNIVQRQEQLIMLTSINFQIVRYTRILEITKRMMRNNG